MHFVLSRLLSSSDSGFQVSSTWDSMSIEQRTALIALPTFVGLSLFISGCLTASCFWRLRARKSRARVSVNEDVEALLTPVRNQPHNRPPIFVGELKAYFTKTDWFKEMRLLDSAGKKSFQNVDLGKFFKRAVRVQDTLFTPDLPVTLTDPQHIVYANEIIALFYLCSFFGIQEIQEPSRDDLNSEKSDFAHASIRFFDLVERALRGDVTTFVSRKGEAPEETLSDGILDERVKEDPEHPLYTWKGWLEMLKPLYVAKFGRELLAKSDLVDSFD